MIWIGGLEIAALGLAWYFLVYREAARRKRSDDAARVDRGSGASED